VIRAGAPRGALAQANPPRARGRHVQVRVAPRPAQVAGERHVESQPYRYWCCGTTCCHGGHGRHLAAS